MIPYLPDNLSAEKLKERIQPRGWEHLGGSFAWIDIQSGLIESGEEFDEYGPHVLVEPFGKIGEMATYFNKHRQFPAKSYLFAGDKGIGKTAFIKLMAMTNLAKEHTDVTYQTNDGREVTLLNSQTGEPFTINPVPTDEINFEMVQHCINHPGDTSNGLMESHNAGMMVKNDVNQVAESVSQPLALFGGRRVIHLNEFDNVGSRQVPALKGALDPGGAIPDGLLILADTNHLQKVRSSMGQAGMDRFETIQFSPWSKEELYYYAESYIDAFGIQFEADTFRDADVDSEDAPYEKITEFASGSIRDLIGAIQKAASFEKRLTKQDLDDILHEVASGSDGSSSRLLYIFNNRVLADKTSPASFVKQAISRQVSLTSFANELAEWLMSNTLQLLNRNEEVHEALRQIRNAAEYREGEPATKIKWATCIEPIRTIKNAINDSPKAGSSKTKTSGTRRNGRSRRNGRKAKSRR